MSGIVWLASYPKSGNTWFRMFLANYLADGDAPISINATGGGPMAALRSPLDEALGYDSAALTLDEIDRLRPEFYAHLAREASNTLYCKIHDAYTYVPDGRPLIPPEATRCALYFVRNPLDVGVSYAHHRGQSRVDDTIRQMADPNFTLHGTEAMESGQLRQRLLTWSGHVASWLDAPGLRVHRVRYEDMKRHPEETFSAALRFLELSPESRRVAKAIEFSRFEELQRQEERWGFQERLTEAARFFRKGEIGSWREVLQATQVASIVESHGATMRRCGYLDDQGQPVY